MPRAKYADRPRHTAAIPRKRTHRDRIPRGRRPLLAIRYVACFRRTAQRGDCWPHQPGVARRSEYRSARTQCRPLRFGRADAMVRFRRDMRLRARSGALRYRCRNLGISPRIAFARASQGRDTDHIHHAEREAGNLHGVKKSPTKSSISAAALARGVKEYVSNTPTK